MIALRLPMFAAFFLLLLSAPAFGVDVGGDFVDRVERAVEEGTIDREEALLNVFHYVFDPGRVRTDLAADGALPVKCLTPMIEQFHEQRGSFRPSTVESIEEYLRGASPAKAAASTYDSPGGRFRLTYETSGEDAVPLDDVDPANGVPDYVEWVASYCDSSWSREIDGMGFNAPALDPGEKYPISFRSMGAYGYTVSTGGGSSYIVIENNFAGFPPNQDPEGNQKGAAKVTVAHEFKHASQMNTTGAMAMGGWVELDATWMEDMVFDLSNDYYTYLFSGSGISDPDQSLKYGGSGSYEDCIWQHVLVESFGEQMGLALMQRREAYPSEGVPSSYSAIIADQGSSFSEVFTNYATWNYMTNIYANESLPGYEEAAGYPVPGLLMATTTFPDTGSGSVDVMATHVYRCKYLGALSGNLRIRFIGDPEKHNHVVALLRKKASAGGGWLREDVPVDSVTNSGEHTISLHGADLKQVAVLVVNPKMGGGLASYTVIFEEDDQATSVATAGAPAVSFALQQNRPNPFNPATAIGFALPEEGRVSLAVYSSAGRVVRTLLSGETLAAGTHTVRWDGRDDRGREAASGVYHYRLISGNKSETKRMVLIR